MYKVNSDLAMLIFAETAFKAITIDEKYIGKKVTYTSKDKDKFNIDIYEENLFTNEAEATIVTTFLCDKNEPAHSFINKLKEFHETKTPKQYIIDRFIDPACEHCDLSKCKIYQKMIETEEIRGHIANAERWWTLLKQDIENMESIYNNICKYPNESKLLLWAVLEGQINGGFSKIDINENLLEYLDVKFETLISSKDDVIRRYTCTNDSAHRNRVSINSELYCLDCGKMLKQKSNFTDIKVYPTELLEIENIINFFKLINHLPQPHGLSHE